AVRRQLVYLTAHPVYLTAHPRRSAVARPRPEVDVALGGVAVDLGQLVRAEVESLDRRHVVLELGDAARADQRRGDAPVAQRPRERHLGEALAAAPGDLVERTHLGHRLLRQQVGRERVVAARTRALRDAVQVAV